MQELPAAARGARFLGAPRWLSFLAALVALASSSTAFAQVDRQPVFTSTPVTAATEGVLYTYAISATDADGDALTITAPTKPAWLTFTPGPAGSGTATLSGTPAQAQVGTHSVALRVSDGTGALVQQNFSIVVANVNDPPAFTSTAPTSATQGVAYSYSITTSDPENSARTLTAPTKPAWLNFSTGANGSGTLSGTPGQAQVGSHNVVLNVSDGALSTTQSFTIVVANVDDQPVFTSTPVTAATEDVLYNYAITATDADGDTLTVAAPTKPAWLTFTAGPNGTATLAGTPTQAQVGNHNVVLSVSDGTGPVVNQSFTIVVANVDVQPVFTSTPVTTASTGALYTYAITATDADGDPLTITAPTKPSWLTFTAGAGGTATLSGTPTQAQVGTPQNVALRVSDGTGALVQQNFSITVTHVNGPPAFTSTAPTAATQGVQYTYAVTTSDPDSADTRTVTAPTKPAWLTFTASANGTATLSGTPAQAQVGSHNVVLSVSDGTVSVTQSFTIIVANVDDQPVFTSVPKTSVNEHDSYVYEIVATDPDADPLTFTAPTLPAWLTFAPGTAGKATLTSKPGRPSQDDIGVHAVVISVSDGTPPLVTQSFQITVVAVDDAPLIAPIPAQTATEGVPFTLNLASFVTDADTPLTALAYTATSGLPPGLAVSAAGLLSGTPALQLSPGDYTVRFTINGGGPTVPGAAPGTVNGTFQLTVLRAGRADLGVTASAAPNPAAVNATATWTFTIVNNAPTVVIDGVTLEATFSGEVPFLFDTIATPGCSITLSGSDTRLACTLGALAGGGTTSVVLTGRGNAAGDVFVSAKVSIPGGVPVDETPANDTATNALSIAQSVSESPAQLITGVNVLGAAAGDVNNDGFTDLAIVTADSTAVFLNIVDPVNPAKRILSPEQSVIGSQPGAKGIALVDVDGDGDLDVVTASSKGSPKRLFVNTNSAFTAMAVGNETEDSRAVVAGDINGDALIDIVFANGSPSTVYKNQGSVGSYAPQPVALGNADGRGLVLVNLFGDALPELVLANGSGDATIYPNLSGVFTGEFTLPTGPTTSVATADFNNDGRADLVFGRSASSGATPPRTQVWLNTSTTSGSFFKSAELGSAPTLAVAVADIDLDGDVDILTTNDTGAHHVYSNTGTGSFALQPQQLSSAGARATIVGKFSVDDRVDVAVVGRNGVAIFYNDGKGNLGAGDNVAPTIQLLGQAAVTLTVEDVYTDAGATATDNMDGELSKKIVVTNKVNTAVIGTYTVTYNVTDTSGNAAQAERSVKVQARQGTGGGGGGAAGVDFVILLVLAIVAASRRRVGGAQA